LVRVGDEFQLQVKLNDWGPIYQISLEEQAPPDWEVQNWFTSTHPDSPFTNCLMAARPIGDRRYALLNDRLTIYGPNEPVERRIARSALELASFLTDFFDIRLPSASDELLKPLIKSGS
jgi:N-hydroxyarylamine O-acetyltransferase